MFNQIMAIGNIGRDPELRYTPQGNPVCSFSLATKTGYGEKEGTTWFNVTVWGKQAEVANNYLSKGDKLHVNGELTERTYTTNAGEQRHSLEIKCRDFTFIETKRENQAQISASPQQHDEETLEEIPW